MNNEKLLRESIRKILHESNDLGPSISQKDFDLIFITPFTDVLKVAGIAAKDILGAAKLNFNILMTLRGTKADKILDKYTKFTNKLDSDYKKEMQLTNKYFDSVDAKIMPLLFAPSQYVGSLALAHGFQKVSDIRSSLSDIFWRNNIKKRRHNRFSEPIRPDNVAMKVSQSIKKENVDKRGNFINEVKANEFITNSIEGSPVYKQMQLDAKKLLKAKKMLLSELLEVANERIAVFNSLLSLNPQEFAKTADQYADINTKQVIEQLKAAATKMVQSSREEIIAKAKEAGKDLDSDGELYDYAMQVVFANAKQDIQTNVLAAREKFSNQIVKAIKQDEPSDEDKKIMKNTELGRQYIELFDKATGYVRNLVQ
jgi:hypothetical protein